LIAGAFILGSLIAIPIGRYPRIEGYVNPFLVFLQGIPALPWVIVAIIWGVVALILYLRGRKQLETVKGAPQTVETVKEFPDTLKRNEENR